ncbi:MAG: 50S ribosomal protein L23 [Armatimonadetes bacterium]|nr:50S ribosomal protein L23 [Armatimonadota bacterium]
MLRAEDLNHYRSIILRPVVTEKSMREAEEGNCYTFEVHPSANKVEISRAVEALFNVTVVKVNTLKVRGKQRRRSYRHRTGRTAQRKKAMVTLAEGDTIDVVEMGG